MITTGTLILKAREEFCLLTFPKKTKDTDLGMESLWVWTLFLISSEEPFTALSLTGDVRGGCRWIFTLTWTQSSIWVWQASDRGYSWPVFLSVSLCWFLNACYRMPTLGDSKFFSRSWKGRWPFIKNYCKNKGFIWCYLISTTTHWG